MSHPSSLHSRYRVRWWFHPFVTPLNFEPPGPHTPSVCFSKAQEAVIIFDLDASDLDDNIECSVRRVPEDTNDASESYVIFYKVLTASSLPLWVFRWWKVVPKPPFLRVPPRLPIAHNVFVALFRTLDVSMASLMYVRCIWLCCTLLGGYPRLHCRRLGGGVR